MDICCSKKLIAALMDRITEFLPEKESLKLRSKEVISSSLFTWYKVKSHTKMDIYTSMQISSIFIVIFILFQPYSLNILFQIAPSKHRRVNKRISHEKLDQFTQTNKHILNFNRIKHQNLLRKIQMKIFANVCENVIA